MRCLLLRTYSRTINTCCASIPTISSFLGSTWIPHVSTTAFKLSNFSVVYFHSASPYLSQSSLLQFVFFLQLDLLQILTSFYQDLDDLQTLLLFFLDPSYFLELFFAYP